MTNKVTDIYYGEKELGKNLYRKKTYYTLCVEQDVLADNKDEADNLFLEGGGIDYSAINKNCTEENQGVETYMVDTNFSENGDTKYMGKVSYDTDTYNQSLEEAKENGDIFIDTYAEEVDEKAESDVDIALNLENESKIGK